MRLAENIRRKKIAICMPWHKFVGLYLRKQGMYRQSGKKLVKQLLSSMCPHSMVNFGPLTAESGWRVWGTPANFSGFCILASLLHRCRSSEVNQTLHDVWPSPGLVHYTVSQKNVPPLTCYNLGIHNPITIIFGRNVTEKVKNRMMLCFPTSPV